MALGEKRTQWQISQVSWTDWTAQDVYYWQEHSFQYAANINTDDELHGIKLANKAIQTSSYAKCNLVSLWDYGVMALPINWGTINRITCNWSSISSLGTAGSVSSAASSVPWVVFQDYFWWGINASGVTWLFKIQNWWSTQSLIAPYDHADYTDESIMTVDTTQPYMQGWVTALLNYNNTRLVVATGASATSNAAIWVYYPELERLYNKEHPWHEEITGKVGWKKVLEYEAWVTVVALTCTFEYLKVWAVDEGWNTKVYYYQGNNNLRSTFVYNIVDLTWEKVLHVYSINGIDYFTTSIDWTDGYVNLNKMIWSVAVPLLHQRAWLTSLDINTKAPYFVGPTGTSGAYKSGRFYIADAYGVFQFTYNPQWYDKGYMKWHLRNNKQVYGVCENKWFLFVSYEDGCCAVRLYDTGKDWYQDEWVLISREYEWREWGTFTKMLDEIRLNYEMNPNTSLNGSIDVYVSPNNLWTGTDPESDDWWYHVMHITQTNANTRTEKSGLFNNLDDWDSAFKFDWQTLTYAIVIKVWEAIQATPIVRQIDIKYHVKDKTNNVYNIKNS